MATEDQIRQTRTLIPDVEAVFGEAEDQTMFSDEEIADFVAVGRNNVLRAAAYACLAIGASEALISKVISTQDLSTNGASVANALNLKADRLLAQADKLDDSQFAYFEIVDFGEGWTTTPELTEPQNGGWIG